MLIFGFVTGCSIPVVRALREGVDRAKLRAEEQFRDGARRRESGSRNFSATYCFLGATRVRNMEVLLWCRKIFVTDGPVLGCEFVSLELTGL